MYNIIQEGLFSKRKNPYNDIIKQYKNDRSTTELSDKCKTKIKLLVNRHFNSKNNTKLTFTDSSKGINVRIIEPYTSGNYLLHKLPRLSGSIIDCDTMQSNESYICNMDNNIIYYQVTDDFSEHEETRNGKTIDVGHGGYNFDCKYSEDDSKFTKIPSSEIFKILNELKSPWYCNIEITRGYVAFDISEKEYEKIQSKIKYNNTYYNKKLYIFNSETSKNIEESYTTERGEIKMKSINSLANLARMNGIENSNNLRDDIVYEYLETIESINFVEESVINKDISLLPVYKVEEGYAIDLDSLKYVVESKEITLEEAIQEIRDVNYIGDTIPMYCVLPSNINESMTLESFISLNETLNKYEIAPLSNRVFNEEDFVNEAAGVSDMFNKVKGKIESIPENRRQKTIDKCKANNKALKEELNKIDKMSKEDQEIYVKKQAIKNVKCYALEQIGSFASSLEPAVIYVIAGPAIGIPAIGINLVAVTKISMNRSRKGKHNFNFNVAKYKKAINNTIAFNNMTIKKLESKK